MTTGQVGDRWVPEDTFGDRVRRVRRQLRMSQEEFAGRLRTEDNPISDKTIGAWESGTRTPRGAVAVAKRMELAFGVPASWLLGLDVVGPVEPPHGPDGGSTTSRNTELLLVA